MMLMVFPGLERKGLVVEIGYDPATTTPKLLTDWECGEYGEIFS